MTVAQEKGSRATTFRGVQALRGLAASIVVVHHATMMMAERPGRGSYLWANGAAGVDIFFVISGFVMAVSTIGREHKTHPARSFMERRLVRLVPLYWLMTVAMIVKSELIRHATRVGPGPVMPDNSFGFLLASFLFVPYMSSIGSTHPVLAAGWTLSFEMLFYALFAFALALRVRVSLMLSPIMVGLAIVGLFRNVSWPAITVWADPILLEFLAGLILGEAVVHGWKGPKALAIASGLIAMPLLLLIPSTNPPPIRILQWGVPAFFTVMAVVSLEEGFGDRWPRWIMLIGDASYSLYLSHGFVVSAVISVMARMHLLSAGVTGLSEEILVAVLSLISSVLVAILLFIFVEKPITNFLRSKWLHEGRPSSIAVA